MICDIIGIQKVDYEKKDGSGRVQGNTIFIARDIPSDKGVGVAVDKEYISGNKFDLSKGCGAYDIEYNKAFNGSAYIAGLTKI